MKPVVLTIAGSDSGAGAGIQSDLKTLHNHGVYGVTVITALTSQNTKGVQSSFEVPAKIIKSQLKSLFDDFNIRTAKTGMLSSSKVIDVIYSVLMEKKNLKLIIDPVLYSKNQFVMLDKTGIKSLINKLLPLSFLLRLISVKLKYYPALSLILLKTWSLPVRYCMIMAQKIF